ncbi:MAG: DUF6351 family protein, partial [Gammaproteobacteria bacterium]|nr:DUF6351 family protein [Gammaproteobacteria bacterium]
MAWTRRKKFAVAFVTIVLVALIAAFLAVYPLLQQLSDDRYAGQPKVVALPPGYDPLAAMSPYDGTHPATNGRPQDPYPYPIPVGGAGPVVPTYADKLDYPFACRTESSGLGQPLVDNHDGAGTPVYAMDESGKKTDRIIGYSKDCSLNTNVYYYYRSRSTGEFVPLAGQPTDIDELLLDGQAVPFVVRLEIGTINRHIYVIAVLRGPHDTPEKPDLKYWNRKLIYQFRGGVGIG